MSIYLGYPYDPKTREPKRMRTEAIWQIGEVARRQICIPSHRPKIDVARLIERSRHLNVNGLAFETHWELGHAIRDDAGNPVLGATEFDDACPSSALIYLNGEMIAERDDLARSTAAHELGHAIFDVPSWMQTARARLDSGAPARHYQLAKSDEQKLDWREWRANEFMGAFLVPSQLLHRWLHKRAAGLGLPMTLRDTDDHLPIIHGRKAGFDAVETLCIDLAEIFGVSIDFMNVRLGKYDLVAWP